MTAPLLFGPCAKRRVQAVLVGASGRRYAAENVCLSPQAACPRAPGEGYEKCTSVCRQVGHAEAQVVAQAGGDAAGGALSMTHWYACEACRALMARAGVLTLECLSPVDSEPTPHGGRA